MDSQTLNAATAEAHRFLRAAQALQSRDKEAEVKYIHQAAANRNSTILILREDPFSGSAESAAVRRASLDLTRALAAMRKP